MEDELKRIILERGSNDTLWFEPHLLYGYNHETGAPIRLIHITIFGGRVWAGFERETISVIAFGCMGRTTSKRVYELVTKWEDADRDCNLF